MMQREGKQSLEERLARSERWMAIAVSGWIVTLAALASVVWLHHRSNSGVGALRAHSVAIEWQ